MPKELRDGSLLVSLSDGSGGATSASQPAAVSGYSSVISGSNGFSLPSAGFSNPMYIDTDKTSALGWDVSNADYVTIAYEGTYASYSISIEQTADATGLTGWNTPYIYNSGVTAGTLLTGTQTGVHAASGTTIIAPVVGVRMRAKVIALGSGTIVARVTKHGGTAQLPFTQSAVTGIIGHAASIAGNPVRVAGRARAVGSPYSTLSADQVADLVTDFFGNLKVTKEYSKTNITTATTTQVLSGVGVLHTVNINKGVAASTVSIYDATSGTTNPIAVIDSALSNSFVFDAVIATGIRVITSGATDVTVTYR